MESDPELDPKGLIREAYRIDGINASQCRSIFLDWALSLPNGIESSAALRRLIADYGDRFADHPMTSVLHEGLSGTATPRRRGGWRARSRD